MDDIKALAAKHHEDAAYQYEMVAKMHREAAKHCASGNFEKAETLLRPRRKHTPSVTGMP